MRPEKERVAESTDPLVRRGNKRVLPVEKEEGTTLLRDERK